MVKSHGPFSNLPAGAIEDGLDAELDQILKTSVKQAEPITRASAASIPQQKVEDRKSLKHIVVDKSETKHKTYLIHPEIQHVLSPPKHAPMPRNSILLTRTNSGGGAALASNKTSGPSLFKRHANKNISYNPAQPNSLLPLPPQQKKSLQML